MCPVCPVARARQWPAHRPPGPYRRPRISGGWSLQGSAPKPDLCSYNPCHSTSTPNSTLPHHNCFQHLHKTCIHISSKISHENGGCTRYLPGNIIYVLSFPHSPLEHRGLGLPPCVHRPVTPRISLRFTSGLVDLKPQHVSLLCTEYGAKIWTRMQRGACWLLKCSQRIATG